MAPDSLQPAAAAPGGEGKVGEYPLGVVPVPGAHVLAGDADLSTIHTVPLVQVYPQLDSNPAGLSQEEAASHRKRQGRGMVRRSWCAEATEAVPAKIGRVRTATKRRHPGL